MPIQKIIDLNSELYINVLSGSITFDEYQAIIDKELYMLMEIICVKCHKINDKGDK